MYFPFFKLRGEEAQAIKSTICSYNDDNIITIIEPYNKIESDFYSYSSLVNTIKSLVDHKKMFILIINREKDIDNLKNSFINFDKFCIRGYYNNNVNIPFGDHKSIAIIHRFSNRPISDNPEIMYHIFMPSVSSLVSYVNKYPKNKSVKIEDGFVKHSPNYTFPDIEDFNSEMAFTYKNENFIGFGDFTILEESFTIPTGAKANLITHVIHLSRKKDNENKIEVRHYLTTPAMEPDPTRRSKKTIEKAYNDKDKFIKSKGIDLLIEKYPYSSSLAIYKRIGIMHHIELIHSLIK